MWSFRDLADLLTEWNFSNRCVRCGFVYSASIDLLRLLWAPVSPSLLGRQSHPAEEQGHGAERSDVFCVEIPHCSCFCMKERLQPCGTALPGNANQIHTGIPGSPEGPGSPGFPGSPWCKRPERNFKDDLQQCNNFSLRVKMKQNKNSQLLLWTPLCQPFLEGPTTEIPIMCKKQ